MNANRSRVGPIYGLHPLNLMIDISRIPFFVKNRNFILFIESGWITTVTYTKYGTIKMNASITLTEIKNRFMIIRIIVKFYEFLPYEKMGGFSNWSCDMNVRWCQCDGRFARIDSNATWCIQTFNTARMKNN